MILMKRAIESNIDGDTEDGTMKNEPVVILKGKGDGAITTILKCGERS